MEPITYAWSRVLFAQWPELMRREGLVVERAATTSASRSRGAIETWQFAVGSKRSSLRFLVYSDEVSFDLLDVEPALARERIETIVLASGATVRPATTEGFIHRLYRSTVRPTEDAFASMRDADLRLASRVSPLAAGPNAGEHFVSGTIGRRSARISLVTGAAVAPDGADAWFVRLTPELGLFGKMTDDHRALVTEAGEILLSRGAVLVDVKPEP